MKKTKWVKKLPIYLVLIILCFFFIFPFLFVITTSLKPKMELFDLPVTFFPKEPTASAYIDLFDIVPLLPRYFGNTLFIALMACVGVLFSCPLVAYSLSRLKWKGRNFLFALNLAMMMIPGAVTMVPIYVMYSRLHLIDTFVPLILPAFLGAPLFIFMLRQFFMGLPKSLEDAARIDGCNAFQIYAKIFLPLMKPALATIAVLQFSNSWNDFMGPLLYLSDERKYTLQIGLNQFQGIDTTNIPPKMAMAVLITLPMIILYFLAQKQFTEGITFSGTKG